MDTNVGGRTGGGRARVGILTLAGGQEEEGREALWTLSDIKEVSR